MATQLLLLLPQIKGQIKQLEVLHHRQLQQQQQQQQEQEQLLGRREVAVLEVGLVRCNRSRCVKLCVKLHYSALFQRAVVVDVHVKLYSALLKR